MTNTEAAQRLITEIRDIITEIETRIEVAKENDHNDIAAAYSEILDLMEYKNGLYTHWFSKETDNDKGIREIFGGTRSFNKSVVDRPAIDCDRL